MPSTIGHRACDHPLQLALGVEMNAYRWMPLVVCLAACPKKDAPEAATEAGTEEGTAEEAAEEAPPPPPPAPKLSFEGAELPADDDAGNYVQLSPKWTYGDESGSVLLQRIIADGEELGGVVFGGVQDLEGNALPGADGKPPLLTDGVDYTGLLQAGDQLYLANHVEYAVSNIWLTKLDMSEDGTLTATSTDTVDLTAVNGAKDLCAADVTDWGTQLGGEEYEIDARLLNSKGKFAKPRDVYDERWNDKSKSLPESLRPAWAYDYGWMTEMALADDGSTTVKKHRAMGRFSHELGVVMPDERTVYMTDDVRDGGGIFMFVAEQARDFSSGQLYAMKWVEQTSSEGGGEAKIRWIPLAGSTSAATFEDVDRERDLSFDKIFKASKPNKDGSCPVVGQKRVKTYTGDECLMLQSGQVELASRYETRRFAALYGASVEFTKAEGLSYDPDGNQVWLAMSHIGNSMVDGEGDVQLSENTCGAIYALEGLRSNIADIGGIPITSDYVATSMRSVIEGMPSEDGETCSNDGIANPDNVAYLPGSNLLVIAEDTPRHKHAMLWAANTEDGSLTRLATAPHCAEWSGIQWFPDVKDRGWLTVSLQHAFVYKDKCKVEAPDGEPRTWTGVLGPFPKLATD